MAEEPYLDRHTDGGSADSLDPHLDASTSARLVEWLRSRHGHRWSVDHITTVVRAVWESYDHAPIRNFVEVLVRNETDEILARGRR